VVPLPEPYHIILMRWLVGMNSEELRLANREAQRLAKEKAALQRIQGRWLYWLSRVVRDQYWITTLSDIKMMRFQRNRRERRARIIQRFVRHALEQRRLHRAHSHLQSLRSVVLFFASNHQLIKKDRAANLIIAFLESVRGVNRLSRIVKNYRARILLVQRVQRNRMTVSTQTNTSIGSVLCLIMNPLFL
jgi:hypothetical protein